MLIYLLFTFILGSFQDHYGRESDYNISLFNQIINVPKNYYIFNCFLEHINVIHGSSLEFTHRTEINLLIEDSMFFNCSSTTNGGVLYFDCPSNGNLTMEKICANSCFATNSFQFAYMNLHASKINKVNYLSLTKCSPDHLSRQHNIRFNSGNVSLNNYNTSYNRLHSYSALSITSSISISLKFLTIVDNLVTQSIAIDLQLSHNFQLNISYMNVIGNNSPNTAVFYLLYGKYFMNNCIFIDNFNTLFQYVYHSSYPGFCSISQSWVRHQSSFIAGGYITLSGISTLHTTATLSLSHFSTYYCYNGENYNQNDLTPCQTLPPILPTPTKCLGETYQNSNFLIQIFHIISNQIISILIFLH